MRQRLSSGDHFRRGNAWRDAAIICNTSGARGQTMGRLRMASEPKDPAQEPADPQATVVHGTANTKAASKGGAAPTAVATGSGAAVTASAGELGTAFLSARTTETTAVTGHVAATTPAPVANIQGTVGRPLRADWADRLPAIIENAGQLKAQWKQLADHVRKARDALPSGANNRDELDALLEDAEAGHALAANAHDMLGSQQSPQASSKILELVAASFRALGRLALSVAKAATIGVAGDFGRKVGGQLADHQMHEQAMRAADLAAQPTSQILALFQ